MKKNRKPESFIRQPKFPGGTKGLDEFISRNLKYPPLALASKVEGIVKVNFDLDFHGKVIRTKVNEGIGYGCDEEAQRLVSLLKFEVPKHKGLRITFHKSLNIRFRLPDKPEPPKFTFTYEFIPRKK